jgi:hypothetical protein
MSFRVQGEPQEGHQIFLSLGQDLVESGLGGRQDNPIIHEAQVKLLSHLILYEMIELIHIDIGKKLTGQRPDRHAPALMAAPFNDCAAELEYALIPDGPGKNGQEAVMDNAGELGRYIRLKHINPAPLPLGLA